MDRKLITSGSRFEREIGFSRAVRVGPVIAVSGTAPLNDDGTLAASGDAYGQTLRCLEIIRAAIDEAGGRIEDTMRTRVMLVDIADWKQAANAHAEFFKTIRPACTFVQVAGFVDPAWLVEIEAECFLSQA